MCRFFFLRSIDLSKKNIKKIMYLGASFLAVRRTFDTLKVPVTEEERIIFFDIKFKNLINLR